MKPCVAKGCFNKPGKFSTVSFHEFPADLDKRLEWIRNVRKQDWSPEERDVLCSKHFSNDCFFYGDGGRKFLRRSAVPTNFNKKAAGFTHQEFSSHPVGNVSKINFGMKPSLCESGIWCVHLDHSYSANISLELANEKLKIERHQNDRLKKRTEKLQRQLRTSEKILSGAMKMIDFSRKTLKPELGFESSDNTQNKLPIEILRRLNNKTKYPDSVSTYPEPLKEFAMKLHLCSPRAYRLVRESFQLSLPSESIIKKWKRKADESQQVPPPERASVKKVKKRIISTKYKKGCSKKKRTRVPEEHQPPHQPVEYQKQDQIEIYETTGFEMEEFLIFDNPNGVVFEPCMKTKTIFLDGDTFSSLEN